jgi:PAS domain S-box-containing protein
MQSKSTNPQSDKQTQNEKLEKLWFWGNMIAEGMAEGIFSLDPDLHFTLLNDRAAKTFGRSKEDLLGKVMWEEFPSLIGSNFERLYRQAMSENMTGRLEDYSTTAQAWFEVRTYPIAEGLIVYFQNITERKQLEQASDGIFLTDPTGKFVLVNDQVCRMLGYSREVLLQLAMPELLATFHLS